MSSIYYSFDQQREQDASFTIKAMGIQLGINIGTAILVLVGFSLLRPKNSLVYAPKSKFLGQEHRPPKIETAGWFAWIKAIYRVKDEQLLKQIGCDALLFIRFIRVLRNLLLAMTIIGIGALIPINIVATRETGDWPPASGSIQILSISGINSRNGTEISDPNMNWYWSPFAATYLFSILIAYFMYRASCDYIDMRQYYFRLPENQTTMKSLIVSRIPETMRSNKKLKEWIESTGAIQHPIEETMIGHHSAKLTKLFEDHELAVQRLESTLASFLDNGKKDTDKKKRPTVRVGGFLGCGGRKVDAIEYYTKEVADLDKEIKELRKDRSGKPADYGWISFDRIEWAHSTQRILHKKLRIKLSPTPKNLIWTNLPLEEKTLKAKRWMGRVIYWVFVFVWFIPMSALSATSNLINLIRLIPNSATFIDNHQIIMGIIQSYFTPIIMALFFYLLPLFFRFLSQQQGYWTQTTLDRKVLTKLYTFFIINNLLVFTLTSMLIGIYGQIRALVESGSLPVGTSISGYIIQIAKNIAEVSTFWINFVCLKSLGLTMDLAMLVPLLTITIKKFLTRPSPRALREMAKPPEFDFPQNYNLMLFFFTIALVYSAMSPLILPFALIYFVVAGMVYKYTLMYIYVTKIESGGKIWPVLFQTVMTSVLFFQVTMIIVLVLKGGRLQAYILIPLPILTFLYQYFYYRRMHLLGSYLIGTENAYHAIDESFIGDQDHLKKKSSKKQPSSLKSQFQDPAYHDKLSTPTVHEDVKHLLPKVYKHSPQHQQDHAKRWNEQQPIELAHRVGQSVLHNIDLDTNKGFENHHKHRMTIQDNAGFGIQFETVSEQEVYKAMEGENTSKEDSEPHHEIERMDTSLTTSTYDDGQHSEDAPLLRPPPIPQHSQQQFLLPVPRQFLQNDRSVTSEYYEMYSSFTPNASMNNLANNVSNISVNNLTNYYVDEKAQIEEEHSVGDESWVDINEYPRRHTAPVNYDLLVDVEDSKVHRHQSLPDDFQFYRASLALSDLDEEEQPKVAVTLRRQLSVPIQTRKKNQATLQRSKTMPSQKVAEESSNNPFEEEHEIYLTEEPSHIPEESFVDRN